jgi:hypothetical protein
MRLNLLVIAVKFVCMYTTIYTLYSYTYEKALEASVKISVYVMGEVKFDDFN